MNQKNFRDMFELLPQSAISMPKGLGKDELGDHLVVFQKRSLNFVRKT